MNIIPKKYLSHKNAAEARLRLRKHVLGHDINDAITQLLYAYKDAKPADGTHIGTLIAMLFDMEAPAAARECAAMFDLPVRAGMSVGEAMMIDSCREPANVVWLKHFTHKVGLWNLLGKPLNTTRYPLIAQPDDAQQILTISNDDGIYAFRSTDGALTFVAINNAAEDLLFDETCYRDDYPLYFGRNTHCISPVFLVNTVKNIFDFVAAEFGYPSLKVNRAVVFNNRGARVLDDDDNIPDAADIDEWEGVNIYMRRDFLGQYIFDSVGSFFYDNESDSIENTVVGPLIEVLAAVGIMYKELKTDHELADTSPKQLRKYATRAGIFRSPDADAGI